MLPPLMQIPADVVSLEDYERLACERVSPAVWAYLQGGAADEVTLRENRSAFDRIKIVPRIFQDLSSASTRLSLLGQDRAHPMLVAPTAFHRLFHPEGERATAAGSAAMESPLVVSTQASIALEEIARSGSGPKWFQLYIQPDRDFTLELMHRAEDAGYQAIVVTADAPISGFRNRETRAGFHLPPDVEAVNLRGMRVVPPQDRVFGNDLLAAAPSWKDFQWLISHSRLPVLLKGILSPDDARMAIAQGASGIVVSNHGGRTLDSVPPTIDVLPAIAAAVARQVPVLLDGGIRRGTDVFKALALGADAVLTGRPVLHGLAAAGAPGVAHVLKILRAELEATMALAGCAKLEEIGLDRLMSGSG